ncbi:MAG: FKBP-type peptidyl-prolyl cis-trans isomerase [Muribaculaceae bacterium]
MKKISILATASLLIASSMISCNGISNSDLKTANDTLSAKFGEMYGYGVAGELQHGPDSAKLDKGSFVKGMELVLNADTSDVSFIQGVALGSQLVQMFRNIKERQHVEFDARIVLNEFKKAFNSDSAKDPQAIQMQVMELMNRLSREALENSPEAIANKKAGEAYIADQMKKDATLKKTESGLVYKVIAEGEGENFKTTDRIMVKYVGKHIDGTEFDAQKEKAVSMSPMGVVPGFKEGLLMMKPGAKFVLYIPGNLAYGPEGRGNIKANETLVFEVETEGVEPEAKK